MGQVMRLRHHPQCGPDPVEARHSVLLRVWRRKHLFSAVQLHDPPHRRFSWVSAPHYITLLCLVQFQMLSVVCMGVPYPQIMGRSCVRRHGTRPRVGCDCRVPCKGHCRSEVPVPHAHGRHRMYAQGPSATGVTSRLVLTFFLGRRLYRHLRRRHHQPNAT